MDAVSQVMELAHDDIQPVPDFGTSVKMDYLIGMAQSGRKFALLLDVDKVLTTEELRDLSLVSSSVGKCRAGRIQRRGTTHTNSGGSWPKPGPGELGSGYFLRRANESNEF